MQNKASQNGGKGRKKPVKKELPTLQDQIQQNLKEAEEQIRQSEIIRKQTEELLKTMEQARIKEGSSNPCKYCLFQKECPLFTTTGILASICLYRPYAEKMRDLIKSSPGIVCDGKLIFWKDTQDRLDKRFNLN